jgi:dTDP-4-amino-4,6-dideoxygalactose transaminase
LIPFNKQNLFGEEFEFIKDAYDNKKISGDGKYTKLCNKFMEEKFHAKRVLLTTSGTHSLDMAALLIGIKEGDEVIMPSYTFVSTVNAFVLRGAKPVFCDIREDNLNIDETKIEALITDKTKAIVPVHYAGVACEMDYIMDLAKKYNLYVIEDAAQGVNSKYKGKYLGTIGHIGCYSFHETKNYSMGEGGAIVINDEKFIENAEIIREKGTNRSKFFRGQVDKYTWVEVGSSYLPSDINAAVLYAQFQKFDEIQEKRSYIYNKYFNGLRDLQDKGLLRMPVINDFANGNAHMFYILLNDNKSRDKILKYMNDEGINCTFHYIPLHSSDYYINKYGEMSLPFTENLSYRLLRLPLYFSLSDDEIDEVIEKLHKFFN